MAGAGSGRTVSICPPRPGDRLTATRERGRLHESLGHRGVEPMSVAKDLSLLVEDEGATRWLTINREVAANAFTNELLVHMKVELDKARADRSVRVVVITGAGNRFFCIGGE